MDYCPHCGELIDSSAQFCTNCGSDDETGWNSDIDYYSVDLPEDDLIHEETEVEPPPARGVHWPGVVLILLAVSCFLWAGFSAYAWGALLPLIFLGLCSLICAGGTERSA